MTTIQTINDAETNYLGFQIFDNEIEPVFRTVGDLCTITLTCCQSNHIKAKCTISLTSASSTTVKELQKDEINALVLPVEFTASHVHQIEGNQFDCFSDVFKSIELTLCTGHYGVSNHEKIACLIKLSIQFNKFDQKLYNSFAIDDIILFHGCLSHKKEHSHSDSSPSRNGLNLSRTNDWFSYFNISYMFVVMAVSVHLLMSSAFKILVLFILINALIVVYNLWISDGTQKKSNGRSMFINGWQAWSYCGSIMQGYKIPMYALFDVFVRSFHEGSQSININLGKGCHYPNLTDFNSTPMSYKDFIASDMFTAIVDTIHKEGMVFGFLTQKEQFGCIACDEMYDNITVHLKCDGVLIAPNSTLTSDWFMMYTIHHLEEPFLDYMKASNIENKVKEQRKPESRWKKVPTGWCSWYHYEANITENDLKRNLLLMNDMKPFPMSSSRSFVVFQIDDGYQPAWGDWSQLDIIRFPSQSLTSMVQTIHRNGMVSGLWMAPTSCDKHSQIAKTHFDWILKNSSHFFWFLPPWPTNSAYIGKWFYGLDVTNDQVLQHLQSQLNHVKTMWGFRYLKLDFLYSCILRNAHDSFANRHLTNAQAIQRVMQLITDTVGNDVFLVGCGAPLGSVIGHVDYNRISADAGLTWTADFCSWDQWNLPSARSMIRNTINRLFMHQHWWINDPDCVILRESTHPIMTFYKTLQGLIRPSSSHGKTANFSNREVQAMVTIKAMSGGSFIISDDFGMIPVDRLRMATQVLPPTNVAAVAMDLMYKSTPEILKLSHHFYGCDSNDLNHPEVQTVITCCNWNQKVKSHQLHLVDVFGLTQFCQSLVSILEGHLMDHESIGSSNYQHMKLEMDGSLSYPSEVIVPLKGSITLPPYHDETVRVPIYLYDFWNEVLSCQLVSITIKTSANGCIDVIKMESLQAVDIEEHGVKVCSVILMDTMHQPRYIGSNLHISCGMELISFKDTTRNSTSSTHTTSLCLTFDDCCVHDEAWGGFFIIYLPISLDLTGMMKTDHSGKLSSSDRVMITDSLQKVVQITRMNLEDVMDSYEPPSWILQDILLSNGNTSKIEGVFFKIFIFQHLSHIVPTQGSTNKYLFYITFANLTYLIIEYKDKIDEVSSIKPITIPSTSIRSTIKKNCVINILWK